VSSKTQTDDPKPRRILVTAMLAAAGGALGFFTALFVGDHFERWDDNLNLGIAVVLLGMSVLGAGVVIFRPSSVPKGCGVLQVTVMALAGLLLLAPLFAATYAPPAVIFGGIVLVLAGQSIANLWLWRLADEMLRRVMMETCALAFWALQTALFLYAAAERLGLVGTVSGWGLTGILMAVYLIASSIAAWRRGIT
jgi:hypothetical protein